MKFAKMGKVPITLEQLWIGIEKLLFSACRNKFCITAIDNLNMVLLETKKLFEFKVD